MQGNVTTVSPPLDAVCRRRPRRRTRAMPANYHAQMGRTAPLLKAQAGCTAPPQSTGDIFII